MTGSVGVLRELSALKATLLRAAEAPEQERSLIIRQALRGVELIGCRCMMLEGDQAGRFQGLPKAKTHTID